MRWRLRGWIASVAWLLVGTAALAAGDRIFYPRHPAVHDPQIAYVLDVLKLAIDESETHYRPMPTAFSMVQSRAISELQRNTGVVDLMWTMTDAARERDLLAVRIPIDRGLIGWRVALIQPQRAAEFAAVTDARELARFHAGQMHDWPDTAILRANGLTVDTSDQYEGLFKMLAFGRIDYFPRSLIEITAERDSHADLGLAIEPKLLIRYPTAFYFFVSRKRPQLAADLERGLRRAVADGKLQALFHRHFDATLKTLDVAHRTVIELTNPLLPPDSPLDQLGLWYHPGER